MFLSPASRDKLMQITKEYKVSQVEATEVILKALDIKAIDTELKAVRTAKVATRNSKTAIMAKLRTLSSEQLAALAKMTPEAIAGEEDTTE